MCTFEIEIHKIGSANPIKMIFSKPAAKEQEYKKATAEWKKDHYQLELFTEKQAFHKNFTKEELEEEMQDLLQQFHQLNAFTEDSEHMLMISKKGKLTYKVKKNLQQKPKLAEENNRKKQYILEENMMIPPLVDMGVFTKEGKVVRTMYDKFRQINRFLEIIDDAIKNSKLEHLNIIDFGCGKSYLTFVIYYYLVEVRHLSVNMVGLDLKKEVIEKCSQTAEKYGYDHLKFELGDINGYRADFDVDMVVTLHACDTATDFALYNAITWNAKMIFSVPCCQHELNAQMQTEQLGLLTRYGIIKERFAALTTDAIRGNLLECCGYKAQLLEFVDLDSTPKNILIRAIKKNTVTREHKQKMLTEVLQMMEQFHVKPMLYGLLYADERL